MPDYCSIRSFKPIKPITRKSRSVGAARAAILRSDIARSAKLSPVANIRYICRFYSVQSVSYQSLFALYRQLLLLSAANCSCSLDPIALAGSLHPIALALHSQLLFLYTTNRSSSWLTLFLDQSPNPLIHRAEANRREAHRRLHRPVHLEAQRQPAPRIGLLGRSNCQAFILCPSISSNRGS